MALLAEEIVEEWLNRQGYFTIRGVKVGANEIDLLAVRCTGTGLECRHIEVQASVHPISYITHAGSAKRRDEQELRQAVSKWIEKKYDHPMKKCVREQLAPGCSWSRELVVHRLKYIDERTMIVDAGVVVRDLSEVVADLQRGNALLEGAAGAHLVELVALTATSTLADPSSATK